jgi:error-prone DNA polymerase
MAKPAEFTHLHVASSYSLRYGTATPAALATRAADLGMSALALTDRDGLFGAFKHVRACADAGIKPLLGADLALRIDGENRVGRVTLLASGRQGWASLCRLVSAAHAAPTAPRQPPETYSAPQAPTWGLPPARGQLWGEWRGSPVLGGVTGGTASGGDTADGVPAVTRELVAEHSGGLVVLLGPASDVGQAVAARRLDLARSALGHWRHLGVDAVAEVVDHLGHKSTVAAARLAELARDTRTPAVLTNAVRYLDPVDSLTAQVLDAARHLVPLGSPRLAPHNGRAYLASQEDMATVAARVAAAMSGPGTASAATLLLGETEELTRRCALDPVRDLGIGARHLPETQGNAYDQYKELRDRCSRAILHGRYRTADAASRPRGVSRLRAAELARDRFSRELDIIAQTGMAGYFLTVADVADRIRRAGIRCAIRGSGAGSFVNHLLGISAIDPLEHGLLMERFLSPVRNTLPDIDLDVESARRLEAYRIIFDAYGTERTACVCMLETYRARSAIRDVAAAMSLPPDEAGAIAKAFPHIRAKHITAALTELPELRQSRLSGAQLETVFGIAQQLDGLPRHVAMHPCGVLLSDRTLLDRTAVQASGEGFPLSQLDSGDAEIAGVIKLDVLGVRMQSAMAHALAEISRSGGEKIDIDAMPRDDEATYAMIQRSQTIGCFQIESPGQRELVKKLAPRDVADLIVDISLFRPGPVNSDMIGPFLRTRHGLAEPRYPHEKLADALRETGGVVVFHEQVLRIIDVLTGCGLAEADLVRRHLSTEGGPERTAPWFRARALARGFDPATVEQVWQVVAAFGGFGFCKAHAAAFAIPVYQSAWLRRHYPAAFYAGLLTHDPGMYPKRVIVADARLSGIQVLPVDVNASATDWKVATPPPSRMAADPASSPHFPPGVPTATLHHPLRKESPASGEAVPVTQAARHPLKGRDAAYREAVPAAAAPSWQSPMKEDPASGAHPAKVAVPVGGAASRDRGSKPETASAAETKHPSYPVSSAGLLAHPNDRGSEAGVQWGEKDGLADSPYAAPAAGHDRGSKQGTASAARAKRPVRPVLPPAVSGRSDDCGSSAANSAVDDPQSWPAPSPGVVADTQPAARASRSLARRLLETTGPLQALRFPGRKPAEPAAAPRAIRCSLREVKGISDAEVTRIVDGQPYTSLRDFWNRAGVSRPVAERLVLLGAFDSLYTAAPSSPQNPPNLRVQPSSPPGTPAAPGAPGGSAPGVMMVPTPVTASAPDGSPGTGSGTGSWPRGPQRQGALGVAAPSAGPGDAEGHRAPGGSALGAMVSNPVAASAPDGSPGTGSGTGSWPRGPQRQGALGIAAPSAGPGDAEGHRAPGGSALGATVSNRAAASAPDGSPGTGSGTGSWPRGPQRQGALGVAAFSAGPGGAVAPGAPGGSALGATVSNPVAASAPNISSMSGEYLASGDGASALPRPTRRDLLARVGVLARQSPEKRSGPPVLDLFAEAGAEAADGMADLVPAGELRDLDLAERVEAELEILGFEVSGHVLSFYTDLLAGLGVIRSAELADQENGATILVAGAKVATQTPAVRSGQRIIFASLDDAAGLVDLAFFESVQDRCAARLFGSWLLVVRGRVRRAGAGPMAVTVNATECWDLPALEEIRVAGGMAAVHAAMAAGDVGPGTHPPAKTEDLTGLKDADDATADSVSGDDVTAGNITVGNVTAGNITGGNVTDDDVTDDDVTDDDATRAAATDRAARAAAAAAGQGESARPVIFANGFVLSPYAETGAPGGNLKHPSRTLWHASPGSTTTSVP